MKTLQNLSIIPFLLLLSGIHAMAQTPRDKDSMNPVFPRSIALTDDEAQASLQGMPQLSLSLSKDLGGLPPQPRARARRAGLHRILGYTTLALAGITALTSENRSVHYACAYSATGLAFINGGIGISRYGRMLSLKRGLGNKHNLHWILASAGAVCCAVAVISADSGGIGSHSGFGVAGGVLMMTSVLIVVL